jgi:purine-cytosine permease-like protein
MARRRPRPSPPLPTPLPMWERALTLAALLAVVTFVGYHALTDTRAQTYVLLLLGLSVLYCLFCAGYAWLTVPPGRPWPRMPWQSDYR